MYMYVHVCMCTCMHMWSVTCTCRHGYLRMGCENEKAFESLSPAAGMCADVGLIKLIV